MLPDGEPRRLPPAPPRRPRPRRGPRGTTVVPYALLVPSRLDNSTQHASFWQPAISFLQRHHQPGYRVEVVPTAEHWEAYWIPKAGFALARGWYRQLDAVDNRVLYRRHLTAPAYREWLQ